MFEGIHVNAISELIQFNIKHCITAYSNCVPTVHTVRLRTKSGIIPWLLGEQLFRYTEKKLQKVFYNFLSLWNKFTDIKINIEMNTGK